MFLDLRCYSKVLILYKEVEDDMVEWDDLFFCILLIIYRKGLRGDTLGSYKDKYEYNIICDIKRIRE